MSNLRPKKLKDIIGQDELIEVINISLKSALKRKDALGHAILEGPAGLGKTTLANVIANELGVDIQVANGASIRSTGHALTYIMRVKEHSILFIDEIHRMPEIVLEFLYPILEDFKLDLATEGTKRDKEGEVMSMCLPKFTLIGATTEIGTLPAPMRDRFKLKYSLRKYQSKDIEKIIQINANKINVNIDKEAITTLSKACRGTPRVANALLEWVRDYSLAYKINKVSTKNVKDALDIKLIGSDGSTENDRRYLNLLKQQNSPIGISTISSILQINQETIEKVIEPFWLSQNKIIKTAKGRIINEGLRN